MKSKAILKDLFTDPVYPAVCPLLAWVWLVSTREANQAYYNAKLEAEKQKIVEPAPMKSISELLKEKFAEFFGVKVIDVKANKVKTPRCKSCACFIGNSNCSTSGRLGDADRGLCHCDRCLEKLEGIK